MYQLFAFCDKFPELGDVQGGSRARQLARCDGTDQNLSLDVGAYAPSHPGVVSWSLLSHILDLFLEL